MPLRYSKTYTLIAALGAFIFGSSIGRAQFTVTGYYPDPSVPNQYDVVGSGLTQVTKMTISPYAPQGDVNAGITSFTVVSDQKITFLLNATLSNYIDLTFSNPNYSVIGVTLINTGSRYFIPLTVASQGQTVQGGSGGQRVLVQAGGSYGNGGGGSNVEFVQNGGTFTGNQGGGSNTTYFEPYAYGSNDSGGGGSENYVEVNSIVVLSQIDPSTIISGSNTSTNPVTITGGNTTVTGSNSAGYGLLSLAASGSTTLFNYIGGTGVLSSSEILIASGGTAIIQNSGNGVLTLPPVNENGGILQLVNGVFVIQSITGAEGSDPIIDGAVIGLPAANNYNGATSIIHGGTLLAGTAGALPSSTNTSLTLGATNDGGAGQTNTLDLLGTAQMVASLTNVGPNNNQVLSSNGTASGTPAIGHGPSANIGNLTVNYPGSAAKTFSGSLGGKTGLNNFGLTKTGTGTLVLSGANSFSGPTSVMAGTLNIASNLLTTSSLSVANGATLVVSGAKISTSGTITNNGTMILSSGSSLGSNGVLTNNGILDLTADASYVLPGNLVNNGIIRKADGTVLNGTPDGSGAPTMPLWALIFTGSMLLLFAGRALVRS